MAPSPGISQLGLIEEQAFKFVLKSNKHNYQLINLTDVSKYLCETRWQIECLEKCRFELNKCKAQVGEFPLHEWEKHTELTEISSNIKKVILQKFTNKPPVITRAWIKFYDIMSSFPLFGSTDDCTIRTLFLCEAPGAFVNAMNHYIRSNFYHINFDWLATTLNPYYEQIDFDAFVLDDRFIQDSHLFRNWFFASLNTGDLLNENFSDDLKDHVNSAYETDGFEVFDCVTGDGAFNCLNDPERQEEMVFKLILKEVLVGTRFLKNNGSLIVKFFTFFSCETISLLYFICNCFNEVNCYKPVASKHGNSEIYLVCLKFNRKVYSLLIPYFEKLQSDEFILKRELIPQDFINQICALCQEISSRQMESINLNVKLFGKTSSEQIRTITRNKYNMGNAFLKKFNMFSIPLNEQLIYGEHYRKTFSNKFRKLFDDYQFQNNKPLFCSNLLKLIDSFSMQSSPISVAHSNMKVKPNLFRHVYGAPYDQINNSKFCCMYILRAYLVASSLVPFTYKPVSCDRLLDILKNILKEGLKYRFYFYDNETSFSKFINDELKQAHWSGVEYLHPDSPLELESDSVPVHLVDLYDMIPTILGNDWEAASSLKSHLANLLENTDMQANHMVVIRFQSLLSRLTVGLLYLISKLFRKITFFYHSTPIDSITPSIFVVLSGFRKLPPLCEFIFGANQNWNKQLLEVVSVPDIICDQNFYDALFQMNSICILTCIKEQLVNKQKFVEE